MSGEGRAGGHGCPWEAKAYKMWAAGWGAFGFSIILFFNKRSKKIRLKCQIRWVCCGPSTRGGGGSGVARVSIVSAQKGRRGRAAATSSHGGMQQPTLGSIHKLLQINSV